MRPDLKAQIEIKKEAVQKAIDNAFAFGALERFAFGHAFLWGCVEVKLKNGKSKYYRECLAYVDGASDLTKACKIAESVPGVTKVWYNLD